MSTFSILFSEVSILFSAELVTAVIAFTHVQKLFLQLNACITKPWPGYCVLSWASGLRQSLTENARVLAQDEIGVLFRKKFFWLGVIPVGRETNFKTQWWWIDLLTASFLIESLFFFMGLIGSKKSRLYLKKDDPFNLDDRDSSELWTLKQSSALKLRAVTQDHLDQSVKESIISCPFIDRFHWWTLTQVIMDH